MTEQLLDEFFEIWLEGNQPGGSLLEGLARGPEEQVSERIAGFIEEHWSDAFKRWVHGASGERDKADAFLCTLISSDLLSVASVELLRKVALHEDLREVYKQLPALCGRAIREGESIRDTRALLEAFAVHHPVKYMHTHRLIRPGYWASFDKMEWPYALPMNEDEEEQYENRVEQYVQLDVEAGDGRS